MKGNYQHVNDFVMDPDFCDWALGRDAEGSMWWQTYLKANPDKTELANQAKLLVLASSIGGTKRLGIDEKSQLWKEIQNRKSAEPVVALGHHDTPSYNWWRMGLRIAASLVAIVVIAIAILKIAPWNSGETVRYATQYGEVRHIVLPDGSAVVLNANSVLTFDEDWERHAPREVKLKGEAFFTVTHQKNHQKFKVALADNVLVEVLGTQFTVTQRPHKTRVVLNEGKVKLSITEAAMLGLSSHTVAQETLQPGDLVEVIKSTRRLKKEAAHNLEAYAAFQQNKLMFVDAPLTEVAQVLKDTYGFDMKFSKPDIESIRYTGTVPYDRVDLLFTALEKLFEFKIHQQDKQLEIT